MVQLADSKAYELLRRWAGLQLGNARGTIHDVGPSSTHVRPTPAEETPRDVSMHQEIVRGAASPQRVGHVSMVPDDKLLESIGQELSKAVG